jgi:hypothetical protein
MKLEGKRKKEITKIKEKRRLHGPAQCIVRFAARESHAATGGVHELAFVPVEKSILSN